MSFIILAHRSAASLLGRKTAPLTREGRTLTFTSRAKAEERCSLLNKATRSGCTSYSVAEEVGVAPEAVALATPSPEVLLREAVDLWSELDGSTEVSGADLLDWFAPWRERAKAYVSSL